MVKWFASFHRVKYGKTQNKIILKMYLIEKKEVTLLHKLNR